MDTTASASAPLSKSPVLKANQILITGRIDSVRPFDAQGRRHFDHRIVLAAQDQYTQPSYILVQAPMKLAAPGDDIKVVCQLEGYRDRFKTRDGEIVETARMFLRALD